MQRMCRLSPARSGAGGEQQVGEHGAAQLARCRVRQLLDDPVALRPFVAGQVLSCVRASVAHPPEPARAGAVCRAVALLSRLMDAALDASGALAGGESGEA